MLIFIRIVWSNTFDNLAFRIFKALKVYLWCVVALWCCLRLEKSKLKCSGVGCGNRGEEGVPVCLAEQMREVEEERGVMGV